MTYRFLTDDEVVNILNPALAANGQAMLNVPTSRVMGAFDDDGVLVESFTLQLFPILGPLVKHDNTQRDSGEVTRQLVEEMAKFLRENDARGWMAIADSPFTLRLCHRYGMKQVESPVFMAVPVYSGPVVQ